MPDSAPLKVLVIDDEKVIRDGCALALAERNCRVEKAEDGERGIARLQGEDFDVVLLDLMMPGSDGFSVLRWIKQHRPDTLVIVITGFATVDKAVSAMKEGAFDFVGKPFTPDYLRLVVQRAGEKRALLTEAAKLRDAHALDLETIDEEQSRLKTVFACMEGAVLVTNRQGTVVLHNPAAIRLLQIQADPVVGKHLSASIRDEKVISMIEQVANSGLAMTVELPSGSLSRFYLRARCAPVRTATGKVVGTVTVFEDITTEKQLEQAKSEFIAMVVHELRAPLASVEQMVYAANVCGPQSSERREHLLGRIGVRIRDQLQMIENLLSLSRLETGARSFSLEPISISEILKQVVEVAVPRAESSGIALRLDPPPPQWSINADRDQIRLVFANIVDNAIKYTPRGGWVTISVETTGNLARIRVADSGVGIHADDLPRVFERFFRVRNQATRHVTGSGLGLSLVKQVVQAHRGYIDIESEPGRGTTVTVSLPLLDTCREVCPS